MEGQGVQGQEGRGIGVEMQGERGGREGPNFFLFNSKLKVGPQTRALYSMASKTIAQPRARPTYG